METTYYRCTRLPSRAPVTKTGIICGMEAEAQALGRWRAEPGVYIGISGARPDRATRLAQEAADSGAHTLLSWGLAGGLAADVPPGSVIEVGSVILPDGSRAEFHRGMLGDLAIAGSDTVVASAGEKAALRARTGAIAVDMESHRLARVAMERGLNLRIVRAVADPYDRALPRLAATALGPDGRPRIARVIAGLVRRPWELPALLAAKRDSDRALAALAEAVDRVMSDCFLVSAPR